MKWWIGGFFTLLLALFTLVVHREQKSGGACYEQHASQDTEKSLALSNEQERSQQADSPESYLCSLITPANLPTDYLVIIGIGGILAAISSLDDTKKSAKAALLNAKAVINAERPWLDVTGVINPAPRWNPDNTPFIVFRVQNKGRTPAQFISGTLDYVFVDTMDGLSIPPNYGRTFNMPNETFLPQDAYFDTAPFINPEAIIRQRNPDIIQQLSTDGPVNWGGNLVFYGQVIYEDVLTRDRHETRWCYGWSDNPRRLTRTGPDGDGYKEYNRYT